MQVGLMIHIIGSQSVLETIFASRPLTRTARNGTKVVVTSPLSFRVPYHCNMTFPFAVIPVIIKAILGIEINLGGRHSPCH